MVSKFTYDDGAVVCEDQPIRILEFAWGSALLSKNRYGARLLFTPIDDLNPMIARVRYPQQAVLIDSQTLWPTELKWSVAVFSHPIYVLAVSTVFMNTIELSVLAASGERIAQRMESAASSPRIAKEIPDMPLPSMSIMSRPWRSSFGSEARICSNPACPSPFRVCKYGSNIPV